MSVVRSEILDLVHDALRHDIPGRFQPFRNSENCSKPIAYRLHRAVHTSKEGAPFRFAMTLEIQGETIFNPLEDRREDAFIVEFRFVDWKRPLEVLGCVTFRAWLIGIVAKAAAAGDVLFQSEHLFEHAIPGIVFLPITRSDSSLNQIRELREKTRTPFTGPLPEGTETTHVKPTPATGPLTTEL